MATATKTWVFAADAEGLAQQVGGGSAPTFAFQSADGNAAGSAEFSQASKSQTNAVCEAFNASTGDTFETLFGVAAGVSISSIRILSFDNKVAANAKLTAHNASISLIDDAGNVIATLISAHNPGTATTAWVAVGAQTGQSVTKSGSDGCRLKLVYTCTTGGGGGGANVLYRLDNIAVEITYTESSGPTTFLQTISAVAVGSASVAAKATFLRTLSATAVGAPAMSRVATFLRTLSASAVGVASVQTGSVFNKTLSAAAIGVASIMTGSVFRKTLTAVAVGVASVSTGLVANVSMSAVAVGAATLQAASVFRQTASAVATGVASLVTEFIEGVWELVEKCKEIAATVRRRRR